MQGIGRDGCYPGEETCPGPGLRNREQKALGLCANSAEDSTGMEVSKGSLGPWEPVAVQLFMC